MYSECWHELLRFWRLLDDSVAQSRGSSLQACGTGIPWFHASAASILPNESFPLSDDYSWFARATPLSDGPTIIPLQIRDRINIYFFFFPNAPGVKAKEELAQKRWHLSTDTGQTMAGTVSSRKVEISLPRTTDIISTLVSYSLM
jgi:hypothetical protein